jgi:MSHA type pilus biogenesis protein MshL
MITKNLHIPAAFDLRRTVVGIRPAYLGLAFSGLLTACGAYAPPGPSLLDREKVATVDEVSQQLMTQRLADESAKLVQLQDKMAAEIEKIRAAAVAPTEPVFNPLDGVTVSLRVDDADVRFVFKAIANEARLNLVLPTVLSTHPRTISLGLNNMPASQVFNQVLKTLDLHGTVERDVMTVQEYQERIFGLDFLQTAISADFSAGGDVFGANQAGGSGDTTQAGVRNGFNIRGRNTNDADPYLQIEAMLKTVMHNAQGSATNSKPDAAAPVDSTRFVLNRSSGTLYVKGRPSEVSAVSRQIEHLKNVLSRQVLIEAQILDIELNDDFQYGIDWSRLSGKVASGFGANGISLGAINSSLPGAANTGRTLTIPAQTFGGAGSPQFNAAFGSNSHAIAINMLKTFGAVHVLSNPSLRVKNTQPAVVSVGRNERYISQTTSNVSNSGGGQSTVSANVITGNLFDGVMLGVIPFISDDGTINLTVNPVQTTVKPGSTQLINVGTEDSPQRISLPKVDFKGITTSLSMRSGDLVILGGLIDETGNRSKAGLPGVAEVPLLGEALGRVDRNGRSRELVVVLRVRTL